MKSRLQKDNRGFTIIEVLIVLAIAGLILLIVFLAVPALQRNSRNTQAKNEAASILGAVNERVNNNNGTLPVSGDNTEILAAANTKNITDLAIVAEGSIGSEAVSDSSAVLVTKAKCSKATGARASGVDTPADGVGEMVEPGTGRQVVLVYQIEDSGGAIPACVES